MLLEQQKNDSWKQNCFVCPFQEESAVQMSRDSVKGWLFRLLIDVWLDHAVFERSLCGREFKNQIPS